MKRDLLIGGLLIVLAALGLGGVVLYTSLTQEAGGSQSIAPKPEPIAEFKKKVVEVVKPEPIKDVANEKKEQEPKHVDEKPKPIAKAELEPLPPPRPEVKVAPKQEEKRPDPPPEKKQPAVEPQPERKPPAVKAIVLGNVTKLNDPDGEYVVKTLHGGQEVTLLGKIKRLTIGMPTSGAFSDATRLEADEIVLIGDINSGSKVLLGKAQTLKIRSLNDQSLLDASELEAQNILLAGAVNSRSTLKLYAPKGSVEVNGEINDNARIEIVAPGGRVLFKSKGDSIINGNAQLKIVAESLELRGAVNGPQTLITVTLTKGGSLQFRRLSGGVRLALRQNRAQPGRPGTAHRSRPGGSTRRSS